MSLHITGIDIGTGSTKAVTMTQGGEVAFTAQHHYSTQHPQPDYSEQDPEDIWQAFVQCIKEVSAYGKGEIIFSLSSAMHSIIAVTEKGVPLTPSITWADTRSAEVAAQLKSSTIAEEIYTASGTPVHSMSPLCKLIWMQQHTPELITAAHKFVSIKEYIWAKLFNEFVVDYSIASATGLFHITTNQWNEKALALAGITAAQLSAPVSTSYQKKLSKETAALLGINEQTTFIIGASDGCLANVGSFAFEQGTAALTIGTSGAVRITSPQPIIDFTSMLFNYRLDDDTFVCGGPINNGGNVMQWLLKNFLGSPEVTKEAYASFFERIDTVPAGSEGLIFLPYLSGERAPVWDAKSCGTFFGVKLQHGTAHFLRAGIEGICYALLQVLEIIESLSGEINQLNVSGGFIHSKVWMQLLADLTGKKLCLIQSEDASAIGAAYFAMKVLNLIPDYSHLQTGEPVLITPDHDKHNLYKRYFEVYKQLYGSLKEPMHQLHTIAVN